MQFGKWKNVSGRTKRAFTAIAAAALVLAIGSALAFIAGRFGLLRLSPERYPEGTGVNGFDIGGGTRCAARQKLAPEAERLLADYSCTLSFSDGREFVLTAEDIGLRTDLDTVLEAAFNGGSYTLSRVFSEYAVRKKLTEIASLTDIPPELPTLTAEPDAALAAVNGRFSWQEGKDGEALDTEACIAAVMSGLAHVEAPTVPVPADEDLALQTPVLLAEYSTSFASGSLSAENRVFNIKKAASLVNGAVVPAGGVFSCNDTLGDRTEKNGWRMAPGITEGGADTRDQPGGGVCQVSTTLYNAALLADMDIVCRQGHSRMVSYAEGGRDATIDTGSIDFKWRNTSSSEVWVFAWTEEGRVNCQLFGRDKCRWDIAIETELTDTVPPTADEYTVDYSLNSWEKVLDNEAVTGYDYDTYRVYYEDGREVKRELVAETHYNMHPRRFRVGSDYFAAMTGLTTPRPTAAPTATPCPTPTPVSTPAPAPTPDITPAPTEEPTAPPTDAPPVTTAPPDTPPPTDVPDPSPAQPTDP